MQRAAGSVQNPIRQSVRVNAINPSKQYTTTIAHPLLTLKIRSYKINQAVPGTLHCRRAGSTRCGSGAECTVVRLGEAGPVDRDVRFGREVLGVLLEGVAGVEKIIETWEKGIG